MLRGAAARGHIRRHRERRQLAVESERRPLHLHVHRGAVLALVPPDEAARLRVETSHRGGGFFLGAQVHQLHAEKFIARIAVVQHRRLVHFKDLQRLQIEDPHRMRVALEQDAVLFFAAPEFLLRLVAQRPFRRLRHRAAHGGGQALAVVLEDVVGRAGLEAFDGREFADGAGHQDERQSGKFPPDNFQRVQSGEVRQLVVGDKHVPFHRRERLQKFRAITHQPDVHGQPVMFQQVAHKECVGRIVFQMQNAERLGH